MEFVEPWYLSKTFSYLRDSTLYLNYLLKEELLWVPDWSQYVAKSDNPSFQIDNTTLDQGVVLCVAYTSVLTRKNYMLTISGRGKHYALTKSYDFDTPSELRAALGNFINLASNKL